MCQQTGRFRSFWYIVFCLDWVWHSTYFREPYSEQSRWSPLRGVTRTVAASFSSRTSWSKLFSNSVPVFKRCQPGTLDLASCSSAATTYSRGCFFNEENVRWLFQKLPWFACWQRRREVGLNVRRPPNHIPCHRSVNTFKPARLITGNWRSDAKLRSNLKFGRWALWPLDLVFYSSSWTI